MGFTFRRQKVPKPIAEPKHPPLSEHPTFRNAGVFTDVHGSPELESGLLSRESRLVAKREGAVRCALSLREENPVLFNMDRTEKPGKYWYRAGAVLGFAGSFIGFNALTDWEGPEISLLAAAASLKLTNAIAGNIVLAIGDTISFLRKQVWRALEIRRLETEVSQLNDQIDGLRAPYFDQSG